MITQSQYNVLRQPTRNLNIKIDLINENDNIVDSFEGIATEGNINLDGNSTYRRSGNLTMVFDKKYNLLPSPDSKIWFNKRIGIHIGVKNYFDEIVWFNMGRFAISEISLDFSSVKKTISCKLLDYMSFLDGVLGGQTSHKIILEVGTPINDAITSVLTGLVKLSIEDISIESNKLTLPYTIEKESNTVLYDIIKEICELYMGWDFYFDENGYFIVKKIRDKRNDPIIEAFDGSDKDLTLESRSTVDFSHVKNSIYAWGRQLDDGTQIKWRYRNMWARRNIGDLSGLVDKEYGDICHILDENNSYLWNGTNWEKLEFKVIPEFNIESIGEKIYVYSNDNLFDEVQCRARCEYELKNMSNFTEIVKFNCVPLYNLKPKQKININIDNLIQGDYLIDSAVVFLNTSSQMNVTCHKIYY